MMVGIVRAGDAHSHPQAVWKVLLEFLRIGQFCMRYGGLMQANHAALEAHDRNSPTPLAHRTSSLEHRSNHFKWQENFTR